MWRVHDLVNCSARTPSTSAASRAWTRCICTSWWIPSPATPSASCTRASGPSRCGDPVQRRSSLLWRQGPSDHGHPHNGREFCGIETHPYEFYLELNEIEHRRIRVRTPRTNGLVERFNGTVLDDFSREAFGTALYETVEALQAAQDRWLQHTTWGGRIRSTGTWDVVPSIPLTNTSNMSKKKANRAAIPHRGIATSKL